MAVIEARQSTNQLPCGIVFLAGLFGVGTFVGAIALLLGAIAGSEPILLLEVLLLLCLFGCCAYGLNRLDPRARFLLVIICALAVLETVSSFLLVDMDWGRALVKVVPPLVLLYYLFRRHVRRAFGEELGEQPTEQVAVNTRRIIEVPGSIRVLAVFFGLGVFLGVLLWLAAVVGEGGPLLVGAGLMVAGFWGVCAFGLNGLKPWAWNLAIGLSALAIMQAVYALDRGGEWYLASVAALPALFILYYLFRPHVRVLFKQESDGNQPHGPPSLRPHRP